MTDEKIKAAVEIAQRAIELSHRVPPEGLKKSKELVTLAHAVVELSADLTALKEKYRWRKQSEEPAPNDNTLIICLLKKGGRCSWQAIIQARFTKQFEEPENNIFFWRPLDLSEEDAK